MNHFQAPVLSRVNKFILITTVVCFLAASILKAIGAFSLVKLLGLSASGVLSGLIFQFLTYPFMETQLMSTVFNCLIVWFIGSNLERDWGEKVYIRFLLLNVISVGLIFTLVNLLFFYGTALYFSPLYGLSGVNFALLIAYSVLYPDRQMAFMMLFPMRARTFCWILVAIEVYSAVLSSFATAWAHLLAMGVSFLSIYFQGRPIFKRVFQGEWRKSSKRKSHLKLVDKDKPKSPKYWH